MKIIVCIKQVPNIAAMKFDSATKTLVRQGVPNEVSSFDVRALLRAIEIVQEVGGEVVALTMGPPQAEQALRHCLALGADRAIHLCDRAFAGADTLATARALALAVRPEAPDLVFCGRYSVDAETGQVGPELAELLGLPQITGARKISLTGGSATVERETDEGTETIECPLPLLLTATEDLAAERFPKKTDRELARTKPIRTVTAAELSSDPSLFGQAGSPTSVLEIRAVERKRACAKITVEELVPRLIERGLFGTWKDGAPAAAPPAAPAPDREIWVVAETLGERLRRVTLEILGQAARLGARAGAVLLGHRIRRHVRELIAHGADRVYLADSQALSPYRVEPHAALLAAAIRDRKPHSVLLPSTAVGRDLAPRLAARLSLGLTGDCIGLEIDAAGNLVQLKPAFGGNIVAPILSRTFPQMATVRPGVLPVPARDPTRRAEIIELPPADAGHLRTRVVSLQAAGAGEAADLDTADVVVGVGMGLGGPEHLAAVRRLARLLEAPLAITRDVADRGWLPRHHQVGLTGKSISPRLYIAVGIKGAFEHTVGVQRAGTIVAVNKDPEAWIWDAADFGIVGDWAEVVPRLTEALAAARPKR